MRKIRSTEYRPTHAMKLNKWVKTSRSFGNAIYVDVIVLRMCMTETASESPTIVMRDILHTRPHVGLNTTTLDRAADIKTAITFMMIILALIFPIYYFCTLTTLSQFLNTSIKVKFVRLSLPVLCYASWSSIFIYCHLLLAALPGEASFYTRSISASLNNLGKSRLVYRYWLANKK